MIRIDANCDVGAFLEDSLGGRNREEIAQASVKVRKSTATSKERNEEPQKKNEEMQKQNEELPKKNEELQKQNEKLRQENAELRRRNMELEQLREPLPKEKGSRDGDATGRRASEEGPADQSPLRVIKNGTTGRPWARPR